MLSDKQGWLLHGCGSLQFLTDPNASFHVRGSGPESGSKNIYIKNFKKLGWIYNFLIEQHNYIFQSAADPQKLYESDQLRIRTNFMKLTANPVATVGVL